MAKVKLRSQLIHIDIPRSNSEPWVLVTVQRVELADDGVTEKNVVDRWGQINKKLSVVALDIIPYFDVIPTSESNRQTTVFGLSNAIKEVACRWIMETYGGTINENGDIIL